MSGRQDTGARRTGERTSTSTATVEQAGTTPTPATPPAPATTAPATTAPFIPTQAGHAVSAPVPVVPAPAVEEPQPAAAPRPRRRSAVALVTAGAVLVAAGGAWSIQQDRAERADARRAAQTRVDAARTALAPELAAPRVDGLVAGTAVVTALRTDAGTAGRAAVDRANAALTASPQAGDGPRGQLTAAIGGATAALDAPAVSLTTLRSATAAIPAPEKAVVEAQAAWQAAEDARIAAEAAAAQAAAQAAAARSTARKSSSGTTTRRSSGTRAPAASSGAPAAAAAPAAAGLPTAGSEASSGAVGAALNAHRAANGLGSLSIVRSGARVEHAMQMAASNSIWHSGTRAGSPKARPEIVGRVSPGNATRMIVAYANSGGHNAQMLGNYSTAYIGAVSYDGWLYTSITFG